MWKKIILATIAVFVVWGILDYVIHVVILEGTYEATKELWRPQGEMKMGLMYLVTFITALVFVYIYARFVSEKNMGNAILFGLIYGAGYGISMGYGSYSFMPIPYSLALVWFLGTVVELTIGGILLGLIVKGESE